MQTPRSILAFFMAMILVLSALGVGGAFSPEEAEGSEIVLVRMKDPSDIQKINDLGLEILERYGTSMLVKSDRQVKELSAAGLDVNPLEKRTVLSVKGHTFDFEKEEPPVKEDMKIDEYAEGTEGTYIVHLLGPVDPDWRAQLEDLGVDVINYVPNYAYEVRMTPEKKDRVDSLDFVDWTGIYHPGYKIAEEVERKAEKVDSGSVRVKLVEDPDFENLKEIQDIDPDADFRESGSKIETILEVHDFSSIVKMAKLKDVYYISPYYEPQLFSEVDSQIMGGGAWEMDNDDDPATAYREYGDHGAYINQLGYTGNDVTVTPADTGLGDGSTPNAGHPDFTGRVKGGHSMNQSSPDDWSDGQSHGTHTAGSITGDTYDGTGTQYEGLDGNYYAAQGLAYDSDIYAVKIFDDGGSFLADGREYEIVEVAKQKGGTYVHSNSWGARGGGAYDETCAKYDRAVRDADSDKDGNQPMVITVAAGNDGPDKETVAPPSVGKNVIGIGATQTYMPNSDDYGARGGFDNPDKVANFSSRGYAKDGRVKPDVSAPGQEILSTMTPEDTGGTRGGASVKRSSPSDAETSDGYSPSSFGGGYEPDGRYEWMQGTSMANPAAAGAASVVVDWYKQNYLFRPSPAMVKALMVNTAQPLEYDQDSNGEIDYIPNLHEGWGRIELSKLEYPKDNPVPLKVEDQSSLLQTGEVDEYNITAARDGKPLNITLTWTDKKAAGGDDPTLKNDLNLEVVSPSGDIYRGNGFPVDANGNSTSSYTEPNIGAMPRFDNNSDDADDLNTVENVFIPASAVETGEYTVRVRGFNIPEDANNDGTANQDYALAIYNANNAPAGTPPDIKVTTPNGGEEWKAKTTEEITWNTQPGDDPIDSIGLWYSLDNGGTWTTLATLSQDTGNYSWDIPNVDSTECLIKAGVSDSAGRITVDTSDSTFTINGIPPAPPEGLSVEHSGSNLENNRVSWNASAVDPEEVAQYNLYQSKFMNTSWNKIKSIDANGSSSYEFVDQGRGDLDGTIWKYMVRAVGENGLEESNNLTEIEPSSTDIELDKGWNFVSFDIHSSQTDLNSILEDDQMGISGNYDKVMYYNADEGGWQSYRPGRYGRYNDLEFWDNTRGVWINMTQADTLKIKGERPTTTEITLQPGWNMVGYPSETAAVGDVPSEVTKVGYFDSSKDSNIAYDSDPQNFEFQPLNGYWLYNGKETTVTWTVNYTG
ncbi:MAG: S8 family serine peptidase [Candidatus Thermoplasmatota archaeon]|nr:S8 family serine peptidase [Candidatus Thermoplasmatota archaeon]